jgi:hypothetical protein
MRRAITLFHDKQELTMKMTLKTLSALAIAAATLTAVTLASGSAASANPRYLGHGPAVHGGTYRAPIFAGGFGSHLNISCFACNLPRPHPTWNSNPWRFNHWGHYPWRYSNWGFRYNRWYWEHRRDRFGYERRPVGFAAGAAPAMASAPAQASAGSQGCLTEQKMPDGSVMFADVCKRISAIAAPPSADPRQ